MKLFSIFFSPLLIIVLLVGTLSCFKHEKKLNTTESQAIEKFKKESGTRVLINGVFSKSEYNTLAVSLNRLKQGSGYLVFGRQHGYRLDEHDVEFKKINGVISTKDFPFKYKTCFDSLKSDLSQAEKLYGTRTSYNILHDLSLFVFPQEIEQQKERPCGGSKMLVAMKNKGIVNPT